MAKIEITINGKQIAVQKDSFLLEAIRKLGFTVPTLCSHKDLTPSGSCRLCMVEVEEKGKKKFVTSCNFPVRSEITVSTETEKVLSHRKHLAEIYLGRWPNVPLINEIAEKCGATDREKYKSELTDENENACVMCGRCKKACDEFVRERIIDYAGRGMNRHITMPFGEVDPHCIGCTSCAYVCPTDAIQISDDVNHPLNAEQIQRYGMQINAEMATLDKDQCRMREVGTAHIVEIMDDYDLLPVHNYKFGSHQDTHKIDSNALKAKYFTQDVPDGCWKGCSMACAKAVDKFELKTGPYKGDKVVVDGPEYETAAGSANMGCFDPEFVIEFNFYCDTYGLDTISVTTAMSFAMECFEAGIISKEDTGGKELKFGAMDEVLECLHEMARGKGFGVEVGQGIKYLKENWSKKRPDLAQFMQDIGMEVKGLEFSEYVTKESLAQQAGYAMAIKGPQHDEAWLIFTDMVNNQIPSFEDKANALNYMPLWRTWFGLMGLCKLIWNDVEPADNSKYPPAEAAKVPGHQKAFFNFFEGMTGEKLDEEKMLLQSGRVYNLQRLMSNMLGKGSKEFDYPPYRAVGPVTTEEFESRKEKYYHRDLRDKVGYDIEGKTTEEKMKALRDFRIEHYEKVLQETYKKRGWDKNGIPTLETLKKFGLDSIPEVLELINNS